MVVVLMMEVAAMMVIDEPNPKDEEVEEMDRYEYQEAEWEPDDFDREDRKYHERDATLTRVTENAWWDDARGLEP